MSGWDSPLLPQVHVNSNLEPAVKVGLASPEHRDCTAVLPDEGLRQGYQKLNHFDVTPPVCLVQSPGQVVL